MTVIGCAGAFEDPDVTHVDGDVHPVRDLTIISNELRLKDLQYLVAPLDKIGKLAGRAGTDKSVKYEFVSS